MNLIDILKKSGFDEEIPNKKYTRSFKEGFGIEAYINGKGVIFHLAKDGNFIQPTIQTIDPTDLAKAFEQLMTFLQNLVNNISQ